MRVGARMGPPNWEIDLAMTGTTLISEAWAFKVMAEGAKPSTMLIFHSRCRGGDELHRLVAECS